MGSTEDGAHSRSKKPIRIALHGRPGSLFVTGPVVKADERNKNLRQHHLQRERDDPDRSRRGRSQAV